MKRGFLYLAFLLGLAQCSDPGGYQAEPIVHEAPWTGKTLHLKLFSAGWCVPCRKELPEIQHLIHTKLGNKKQGLKTTLYVGEGYKNLEKPTLEMIQEFKKSLGLEFDAQVDPWRWTGYKKYFGSAIKILAAVVLSDSEEVLETFVLKKGTTEPIHLIDYLNQEFDREEE